MSIEPLDIVIPQLEWDDFLKKFRWKQGEHMTAIGPTQSGKTTLIKALLPLRKFVCVGVTKKRDPLIKQFEDEGYKRMKSWKEVPHEMEPRVLLHPPFARTEPKERHQHEEFAYALDRCFDQGHWTFYADELPYLVDELKLERKLKRHWNQGQGMKTSLVSSAQRPAFLPLLAYSAATHVFFFKTTDEADLKRIGGLGGINNKLIRDTVAVLDFRHVLYLHTRSGKMYITKVDK
jgi:hypothetical protein